MKLDKVKIAVKKFNQIRYCEELKQIVKRNPHSTDLEKAEIDAELDNITLIWIDTKIHLLLNEIDLL